ncbi:MAG: hypothetical protein JO258_21065, partial [Alphaproteobacteria bacterium]|nr:hypothetical protein [Alphaproteobacteria bacterium]
MRRPPGTPSMAAPQEPDADTPLAPTERDLAPRAIRMLRLLLVSIIVVPLIVALAGGYLSYRADVAR